MGEMRGQRHANGGNFPRANNMRGEMTRLKGEIINKDNAAITLKIKESGSGLIFYSDETKILRFKIDADN